MRKCVISLGITGPNSRTRDFERGVARVRAGLIEHGFEGDFLGWDAEYPPGAPPHEESPFGFKPFCFEEARRRGYELVLWVDSSIRIKRPIEPLFHLIEQDGYLVFREVHSVGTYCKDAALEPLGIGREESFAMPSCAASTLGLDLRDARALQFLARWKELAVDGVTFPGPKWSGIKGNPPLASPDPRVKGHRHDQTAASVILLQLGMDRWKPMRTRHPYVHNDRTYVARRPDDPDDPPPSGGARQRPRSRSGTVRIVRPGQSITRERSALLLHVPHAFWLAQSDPVFRQHQNLARCRLMVAVLDEQGYAVDVPTRGHFQPSREYDLVISEKRAWNGNDAVLENATKLFLATTMNYVVHNANVRRRHESLARRRDVSLQIRRAYSETMPAVAKADAIVGVGNGHTAGTWSDVFPGPIYPFNTHGVWESTAVPAAKDFSQARRNFLFFASDNQMQRGLDLLLEVFPRHPRLHLYVCSRFEREADFRACYYRELYETPNVHPIGFVDVAGATYQDLIGDCAFVVHPTCSEGQSGAVVQCMHAGLIPLVTREAGIDTDDFGITFDDDSLEEIERVVLEVSELPLTWHREQSARTRAAAVERFSERAFVDRWREILDAVVD